MHVIPGANTMKVADILFWYKDDASLEACLPRSWYSVVKSVEFWFSQLAFPYEWAYIFCLLIPQENTIFAPIDALASLWSATNDRHNDKTKGKDRGSRRIVLLVTKPPELFTKKLKSFCKQFDVELLGDYDPSVTHVVTSTCGHDQKAKFRTIKYLLALLQGKWILSPEWITGKARRTCPRIK